MQGKGFPALDGLHVDAATVAALCQLAFQGLDVFFLCFQLLLQGSDAFWQVFAIGFQQGGAFCEQGVAVRKVFQCSETADDFDAAHPGRDGPL